MTVARQNLPSRLTSFVGRERELAELERLAQTRRLLTLTGPGGCGKTRLSLELETRLAPTYPDDVFVVSLAPLSDPTPVPFLTLPARKATPSTDLDIASAVFESEAGRLFVERARSVQPDFSIDAVTADAIAEICVRVDGLPLALELAAARVRLLSPPAMVDRLHHRLPLLTGGARDLPTRQQTLAATIDWSYDLLDKAERGICSGWQASGVQG